MQTGNEILTLHNFEVYLSDEALIQEGKTFFSEKRVQKVTLAEPGLVLGFVLSERGSRLAVKILFNNQAGEENEILDFHCTCNHVRGKNSSDICKHIVATFYFLRNNGLPSEETQIESQRRKRAEKRALQLAKTEVQRSGEVRADSKNEGVSQSQENSFDSLNCLEKEAECQVCLEFLERPVFAPCFVHSLCYSCLEAIFQKKASLRKKLDDEVKIECPTCGTKGGSKMMRSMEEALENKELERILLSYKEEKRRSECLTLRRCVSEGGSSVADTLRQIEDLISSMPLNETDKVAQFVWEKLLLHNTNIKLELLNSCRVIQYKTQQKANKNPTKTPQDRVMVRRSSNISEDHPVQKKRKH